jgi:hypothetical protein
MVNFMRILLVLMALSGMLLGSPRLFAQHAALRQHGNGMQLVVDGKPFIVLGGELGNSSASSEIDIERIFPKLERMKLNTVLVPAYWDLIEPQEGVFDFSLTDKVISQARKNNLKVVFLWFGAWKNSMSCYAPEWFKRDYVRYPRAHTSNGRPLEIASVFSQNVFHADNNAFSQWMDHIASTDNEQGTVIMIQIENEIGMLEDARDHSAVADSAFNSPVPAQLIEYLQNNRNALHNHLLKKWTDNGARTSGSWTDLFGNDVYTDEIFMAWHYASYVERLAQTARATYDIPLYVNAAMNSRGRRPGEYPSAGPLAHLMDVWHCAAPSVDIISPDIYDDGFKGWVAQYHTAGNPLFIPECKATDNNGVRAFYVFGEHDAIGISPFSIEDVKTADNLQFVRGYAKLGEIAPLLTKYQGSGQMHGLLFSQDDKERILDEGNVRVVCRHSFTLPWDSRATDGSTWPEAGAVLIRISDEEYILSGNGVVVEFLNSSAEATGEHVQLGEDGFLLNGGAENNSSLTVESSRVGLATVDEVTVNPDATLTFVRRLSGDQTHQGRHVRISVGEYKTLYIRLYTYK